ncbi:MAG TPA: hypothetical protein VLA36_04375 [Longimicrobiales bacterium]|nr:hypothetical protein [Longimicrobiales bacterium]
MSPIIQEQRVLVAADGREGAVYVSEVAPGRYRLEELFGFCVWADDDTPEDAGVGWILEADELEDGRLDVKRILPDPDVEAVSGYLVKTDFMNSLIFERFTRRIVDLEGSWGVFAGSIFSGYVSRSAAEEAGFTLLSALEEAIDAWEAEPGEPSDGAYLESVEVRWALRKRSTGSRLGTGAPEPGET